MNRVGLALFFLATTALAQQQIQPAINIAPDFPSTHDAIAIDVRVPWSDCMAPIREVSRDGSTITIGLRSTGALCPVTSIEYFTHLALGALPAGQYFVHVVRRPDNTEIVSTSFDVAPAPVVTSIEPRSAAVDGGTAVTIRGENLYQDEQCGLFPGPCSNTVVYFGDASVGVISHTETSITVNAPTHAAGLVDVTVRRTDGRAVTDTAGFLFGDRTLEKWLLPVSVPDPVDGAYGSRWLTELAIGTDHVQPTIILLPTGGEPRYASIPENGWFTTQPAPRFPGGGAFIYVDKAIAGSMLASLRVRNVGENATSFGATIPIVSEKSRSWKFTFVDVPTDPRYRLNLRVYDFSGEHGYNFTVIAYRKTGTDRIVGFAHFVTSKSETNEEPLRWPGYGEVNDIVSKIPAMASESHVDIGVQSGNFSFPMWALLTVTDNETQQVTIVPPAEREP